MDAPKSNLEIPKGLPATTADKIAKLARLITTAQDQPYPNRKTNQVLPAHLQSKQAEPVIPELSQQQPIGVEEFSLRGGF